MKRLSVFDERRVPQDIRKYVMRCIFRRVFPCVLMMVIFFGVLILYDRAFFGEADKPFRTQTQMLGYAAAIVLPMLLTGVPFKLIDTSFEGVVEKVHAYTTVEDPRQAIHMNNAQYQRLNVRLSVRTPSGHRIRRSIAKSKMVDKRILEWYHVGDRVIHLFGTPYTTVLPKDAGDKVRCVICGKNNEGRSRCCDCGYSLIIK